MIRSLLVCALLCATPSIVAAQSSAELTVPAVQQPLPDGLLMLNPKGERPARPPRHEGSWFLAAGPLMGGGIYIASNYFMFRDLGWGREEDILGFAVAGGVVFAFGLSLLVVGITRWIEFDQTPRSSDTLTFDFRRGAFVF